MKSVLVVSSKFAPHMGGTAVVWSNWCRHWPSEGLTVIAPRQNGDRLFDEQQPYRIIRCGFPDFPKVRMPALWLNQALRLAEQCLRHRPDLIHFSHVFENGFMGPLLKRLLGIPYFIHAYAEELVYARNHVYLKALVGRVLRDAAGVTSISKFTSGLLGEFGLTKPPLLVHPGVDTARFHPKSVQQNQELSMLTVGRLMERKGHARVIRLMPALLNRFPNLVYKVAGTGPYETRLRALTESLGLMGRVRFLGAIPETEMVSTFQQSSVFVHPSTVTKSGDVEGFGIVFLEAASCGIPVVGSRTGGIPDSVQDGKNGFLIDTDDELLECLTQLLADQNLRHNMGQAGRQWASRFSWQTAADSVWSYSTGLAHRLNRSKASCG